MLLVKASATFPPVEWLKSLGFQITKLENGCVHSVVEEKSIDLLWIPCGISIPAAIEQFRFIVHEDVWRCRPNAVKTRIHSLLNINKRVHGRQCVVKRINKSTAEVFLNQYHTGGYVQCYFKYGLFYKDEFMACATFSKKRKFIGHPQPFFSAELLRFAVKDGFYVAGGLHKLISCFLNETGVNHLMTYADKEWTAGRSYEKIGFIHEGDTPPLTFSVNTVSFERTVLKHPSHTLADNCYRVSNLGNKRFVLQQ